MKPLLKISVNIKTLLPHFQLIALCLFMALVGNNAIAQSEVVEETELEKINRELENPLAKRWSLAFQENHSINQGDLVDGNVVSNTFFFQPALPIPFGKNMVFTARPVFPIITSPDFATDASAGINKTGFGDIQMATLLGPGNASGWVWGAGASFVFPTAPDASIGNGKYQAGPALMVFHLSKTWTKGLFLQHWWSYLARATVQMFHEPICSIFLEETLAPGHWVWALPLRLIGKLSLKIGRLFPLDLAIPELCE